MRGCRVLSRHDYHLNPDTKPLNESETWSPNQKPAPTPARKVNNHGGPDRSRSLESQTHAISQFNARKLELQHLRSAASSSSQVAEPAVASKITNVAVAKSAAAAKTFDIAKNPEVPVTPSRIPRPARARPRPATSPQPRATQPGSTLQLSAPWVTRSRGRNRRRSRSASSSPRPRR